MKVVPLERILLESDGPYFSPRVSNSGGGGGKSPPICHSGYIPIIARKIAELKSVTLEKVYTTTR